MKVFSLSVHRLLLVLIALCTYPGLQFPIPMYSGKLFIVVIIFLVSLISVILYPRGAYFAKSLLGTAVPLCTLFLLILNFSSEAMGLDVIIILFAFYTAWLWLIIYSSVYPGNRVIFAIVLMITIVALGAQFLVYTTQKETHIRKGIVDEYSTILVRVRDHDYENPHSILAICTQLANTVGESSGRSCAIALALAENDVSWCDSIQDEADRMVSCYLPLTYTLSLQDQINVCRSSLSILARDVCLRGIVSGRPNINEKDAQEVCSYSSEKCLTEWGWRKQREIVTR